MWRIMLPVVVLMFLPFQAMGQTSRTVSADAEVTFTKDVAPILYANCVYCHRPGEIGPMSLLTYNQVRPWARAIRQAVLLGTMPPWHADPHYGSFANDRRLGDRDIQTIVAWIDNSAREGNPGIVRCGG